MLVDGVGNLLFVLLVFCYWKIKWFKFYIRGNFFFVKRFGLIYLRVVFYFKKILVYNGINILYNFLMVILNSDYFKGNVLIKICLREVE